MYKVSIVAGLIVMLFLINNNIKERENIIPKEAIRLRVIGNSNSPYDQYIKIKVRDKLQSEVYKVLKEVKNIDEARIIIINELKSFDDIIKEVLNKEENSSKYELKFGTNYFPKKEYKGIAYEEGYYESLLVKLGEGRGDNWWCVLFPPLCLIEAEESTDVEYKFFVKEIINRFFKK